MSMFYFLLARQQIINSTSHQELENMILQNELLIIHRCSSPMRLPYPTN
uniref:Uncharacterized protein n=1 Tax=Arundo donax TaxID=35708 RepID=A0A0A8Z2T9_ARUDO